MKESIKNYFKEVWRLYGEYSYIRLTNHID